MSETVTFRVATAEDWGGIWTVFAAVVVNGDTYPYPADISGEDARRLWMPDGTDRHRTYVAESSEGIVATAYLRPNQIGRGSHVANAGWMVAPGMAGRGIGRRFAVHVMDEARTIGFTAMQFNAVVATNTRAIGLWESMGFEIVGTVPNAFEHATNGPTAVHIMYREL